jgi:hypothetical protein
MQGASWVALLQRIPKDRHDNLMLMTTTGIEVAIQGIIRSEHEYLVLRARLAGTDVSRILFLPFDQITYVAFQKTVKEVEVRAMFGEAIPAEAEPKPKPKPELEAPAPDPAAVEPAPPPVAAAPEAPAEPPAPPKSGPRQPLPDKNAILERLRSRSQGGTAKPR